MAAQKSKNSINLVMRPEEQASISAQFLTWALTFGRYIIIIIQIMVLSVFFMRFKLDRDRTDLKEAVVQKKALIESFTDMESEINRIHRRLKDIRLITTNQDLYPRLMNFLEKNTPTQVTYTLINFNKENVSLSAVTQDLKTFNSLLRKIQDENLLTDLELSDLKRRADGKVEFKIQAKLTHKSFD